MRVFCCIAFFFFAVAMASATPSQETSVIKTGDDPAFIKPRNEWEGKKCIGISLCTERDLKGDCYWGCFPPGRESRPSSAWGGQIISAKPDPGTQCTLFMGIDCSYRFKAVTVYDGGNNLAEKHNPKEKMGCFYCMGG